MKQIVRISILVLVLLLLSGCQNLSASEKENRPGPNSETGVSADITDQVVTTPNDPATITTSPTVPDATETTAPMTTEQPVMPISHASAAGFDAVYVDICRLLDTGSWDLAYTYANTGMMEVVGPQNTKAERYSSITYALEDINNDGIQEMIVLDAMGNTRILAIFALQNGQPVMIHEGWYRSRLYRLSDGSLYSEGSGGAAYSIFEANGQCWFTYPKGEDLLEIGYYYAADGSYDPTTAQEITADEYNAKQTEFAQKITAFSVYNFS